MYVTWKCGSPICNVLLTAQNTCTSAGTLIHRQQKICWSFSQTRLSSVYRHKLIVTRWILMKHQALLTIWAKLKLAVIFFFYFSVAIDSGEILASVWQEEGNSEVLRRCCIQIYPTIFFAMLWKSC